MIEKFDKRAKCDVRGCKRDAEYGFEVKGHGGRCLLCKQCLMALASEARQYVVPKSPVNHIKKKSEERSE